MLFLKFFLLNFAKFVRGKLYEIVKISLEFVDFRADFCLNFTKSCRIKSIKIIRYLMIFAENCQNLCEIGVKIELDTSSILR